MKKAFLLLIVCSLVVFQINAQTRAEKRWVRKQLNELSLDEKIDQLMFL